MSQASNLHDRLQELTINNEIFYKIENSDDSRPFFMSITSAYDHWMFISSNGGLTAGRKNSEYALFPYYTDDKITESIDLTGSKTIIKISSDTEVKLWEPFSSNEYKAYNTVQNLYKNRIGNKVIFEEINSDLGLSYRYQWSSSDLHGFIRSVTITNESNESKEVEFIDGLLNIVPAGVGSELQSRSSNLADAYKRSILEAETGLGIYALSAVIVDKAEPSEALKANVVWTHGLENGTHLLSASQLDNFRNNRSITQETDIKGEKGAYLVHSKQLIEANGHTSWQIIADVNKNHAAVFQLIHDLKNNKNIDNQISAAVQQGDQDLTHLVASADGIQKSSDSLKDGRHFANVMFNIMRGGIFDENFLISNDDFSTYLEKANKAVYQENQAMLDQLADHFTLTELNHHLSNADDTALIRLSTEYLPLKFSRRHGDPSRPWNKFSINLKNELDGSKILDYQGNWRDIFQNWEALSLSYPGFINGMVYRFLNASTFDGYNPYRVTKDGFDWETIEPDDPWSYIGYWGDHQIIYLLKLLECLNNYQPQELQGLMEADRFVYAAVPYRIKSYEHILDDPKDTVEFDLPWDESIRERREQMGSDGALLATPNSEIYHVNFIEKILATTLSKVSNLIPEGGIWMNTQRPEWNDANNALVGNGISMVTLYYLYRFANFFEDLLSDVEITELRISAELLEFFNSITDALNSHSEKLERSFTDVERRQFVNQMGEAGAAYRSKIYDIGFSGNRDSIDLGEIKSFFAICKKYFDHTIRANRRNDGLYHAYNILNIEENALRVSYLSEMLEGQVAVLSAGILAPQEVADLLDHMRTSKLYRSDQNSYILYPNKELPNFLEKNAIPANAVEGSELLQTMIDKGDTQIVERDVFGGYHFNGNFRNNNDLSQALQGLNASTYPQASESQFDKVLGIYEDIFNHKEFTGRSGTFYGYEGLGSIYWHMVSKLLLAVQENYQSAINEGAPATIIDRLADHYYEVWNGLGVHKDPKLYGAFTTDPYSHTPYHKGAQQPGMTGQVKEDIISRFGELGVKISGGVIQFKPTLLKKEEFLSEPDQLNLIDIDGNSVRIDFPSSSLAFTLCQVPIVYTLGGEASISITLNDGTTHEIKGDTLSIEYSKHLLQRTGSIKQINIVINKELIF